MSINDFVKSCIKRQDGSLLCWDDDAQQCVIVEVKKSVVSIKDLTKDEIMSLKDNVDNAEGEVKK